MEQLFLGKLFFAFSLRETSLGNFEASKRYLIKAIQAAPSLVELQEELSWLVAFWAMRQPIECRQTSLRRFIDNLPGDIVGFRRLRKRILGKIHIAHAFDEFAKGYGDQTRNHILKALCYDLTHLKNRGVVAIIARSFLNRRASEIKPLYSLATFDDDIHLESIIRKVEAVLGCGVDEVKRIAKGYSGNKIYLLDVDEHSYILRVIFKEGVERTAAVVNRVRDAGVLAPRIVVFSASSATGDEPAWLLEHWSPGSWFIPPDMSHFDALTVIADLGRLLRDLHMIKTKGFGRITSTHLDSTYATFEDWLDHRQRTILEGCCIGAIPESSLSVLSAADLLLRESFSGSPVLCHGDLGRGNILVDSGQVDAIIDWEDSIGGDPAYDIGVLFASMSIYWNSQKISEILPIFLQTYGGNKSTNLCKRVIAHRLLYAAHEVAQLINRDENEYFNAYKSILINTGLLARKPEVNEFSQPA